MTIGNGATFDVVTPGASEPRLVERGRWIDARRHHQPAPGTRFTTSRATQASAPDRSCSSTSRAWHGGRQLYDPGRGDGDGCVEPGGHSVPFRIRWHDLLRRCGGSVSLNLQRKTAAELDLNASETAIFDAALIAADFDLPSPRPFLRRPTCRRPGYAPAIAAGACGRRVRNRDQGLAARGRMLADPKPASAACGCSRSRGVRASRSARRRATISGWGAASGTTFRSARSAALASPPLISTARTACA